MIWAFFAGMAVYQILIVLLYYWFKKD